MRAHWEALKESLSWSVRTLEASRQFRSLSLTALGQFEDPVALVAFLSDRSIDPGERNAVYASLVEQAQRGDEESSLAMSLLWLGLWPALDAVYRRQLRFWRSNPDGLVSEISDAFTSLVRRTDLRRVQRVAATLVRSTERDVREARQRALKAQATEAELPDESALPGAPCASCPDDEIQGLRDVLQAAVGSDTDLLIAVLVLGETQAEAAARLGLSHDVARKRFQRALSRARQHFQEPLSHFARRVRM
jgi:hypothetical protein